MNLEELRNELIADIDSKIATLKQSINADKDILPALGSKYYFINGRCEVAEDTYTVRVEDGKDDIRFAAGNLFLYREEAKKAAEWVKASLRLHRAYRKLGECIKTRDFYTPIYNLDAKEIQAVQYNFSQNNMFIFYHRTVCENFIKENRDDLKIFLGVVE